MFRWFVLCSIVDENDNNSLVKYKFEKQNLIKVVEKEKEYDKDIRSIIELNDGTIVSRGDDCLIQLWEN